MKEQIIEEAAIWHQALQSDDADWDGFTVWLEADPAHRQAYDEMALIDDALDGQKDRIAEILPSTEIVEEIRTKRHRRMIWAGGAVAASLALIVAIPMTGPNNAAETDYRTAAGQTRRIALADGSQIILGPSSHLAVSGAQQEKMRLEGGAWFNIRHNPDRQLIIMASGQRISDIGTQFDLLALSDHFQVAVAEGRIAVATEGTAKPIELPAGHSLTINKRTHLAHTADAKVADIGSWRNGELIYNNASLSLVAADISRYAGHKVVVSPELADRCFSGVLKAGNGAELINELGDLMGLETKQQGDGFSLVAGKR